MTVETTTAVRAADSTEYLRYPLLRGASDPTATDLTFRFVPSNGGATLTAAGGWHQYEDEGDTDGCGTGWWARVLVGPGGLVLPAGSYRVVLTVSEGAEAARYALGGLLVKPATV